MFLPQPIPRALVEEALALAQYAPSNSNIQPWHLVFASGPTLGLVEQGGDEAQRRPPTIPPLPESFQHYRRELGAQVYGAMGALPARTRRDMRQQSCATGSSSARRWLSRRNCRFCAAWRLATPTQTFPPIACTSAVRPSGRTWCSSTAKLGESSHRQGERS
jgi:nitroreductase